MFKNTMNSLCIYLHAHIHTYTYMHMYGYVYVCIFAYVVKYLSSICTYIGNSGPYRDIYYLLIYPNLSPI